jgi:hypothetical protein
MSIFNRQVSELAGTKKSRSGISTNCRYGHHDKCHGQRRESHGIGLLPCTCPCHRSLENNVVQSVMRRLEETQDMICEPCRQAGRGAVAAHYPAQNGQPAMCWYCKNEEPNPLDRKDEKPDSEEKPMGDVASRETVMENTKAGRIPKGVCATSGCMNHRHASDCTGYCQACKRKQKQVDSATRKQVNPAPKPTVPVPVPVPVPAHADEVSHDALRIESSMVDRLWTLIDSKAQAKALNALWPKLSAAVRMDFLKAAVEQVEAPTYSD